MGEFKMKLTKKTLKRLIEQVVKENSMILSEEQIGLSFQEFKTLLDDKSGKGGLQRLGIMSGENPRGVGTVSYTHLTLPTKRIV